MEQDPTYLDVDDDQPAWPVTRSDYGLFYVDLVVGAVFEVWTAVRE